MFSKRSCWSVSAATKQDYIAALTCTFVVLVSRELIPLGNKAGTTFLEIVVFRFSFNFQKSLEDELYMLIHHFMSSSA